MFDVLSPEQKSLAVRTKVQYAPHPVRLPLLLGSSHRADNASLSQYVWMAPAKALSTGLGIESEGKELPKDKLPAWEESKIKLYPVVSTTAPRLQS